MALRDCDLDTSWLFELLGLYDPVLDGDCDGVAAALGPCDRVEEGVIPVEILWLGLELLVCVGC